MNDKEKEEMEGKGRRGREKGEGRERKSREERSEKRRGGETVRNLSHLPEGGHVRPAKVRSNSVPPSGQCPSPSS